MNSLFNYDRDYNSALAVVCYNIGIDPLTYINYIPTNYFKFISPEEIQIPNHIKRLEEGSLNFCKAIDLSNTNITEIPTFAMDPNEPLESIKLPRNLKVIEDEAFSETNLRSIVIPDSVETIKKYAFEKCLQLEKVKLGKHLQTLGNDVFSECSSLKEVIIPHIKNVGNDIFWYDFQLKQIKLSKNAPQDFKEYCMEKCANVEFI